MIEEFVYEESPDQRVEMERLEALAERDAPELIAEANAIRQRLETHGRMLRTLRESAGLELSDVAERAGLDERSVERLRRGGRVRRSMCSSDMRRRSARPSTCGSSMPRSALLRDPDRRSVNRGKPD